MNLFKRKTTAEKLEAARKKAESTKIKNTIPAILRTCHFRVSDGYCYLGEDFNSLSDYQRDSVMETLQAKHGFILMKSDIGSVYAVFSEEVASRREAYGWVRISVEKASLPIPTMGTREPLAVLNVKPKAEEKISPLTHYVYRGKWWRRG